MNELHYLHGKPQSQGLLRTHNSDFMVNEILPFSPTGEGEHHMLHIRKEGLNTVFVAEMIAKFAKVHPKEVTYAGQKDKHAITEQWFGVRIPGKEMPQWEELNSDKLTVLSSSRHGKKLRIGALLGNQFILTLRGITDVIEVSERLALIAKTGVPNYFGEQRFGHDGKNLVMGRQMLLGKKVKDRKKSSMYLSAVRSNIFNQVVSHRLATQGNTPMDGDCVMLAGSRSYFVADSWDSTVQARLDEKDIQLSAPLWGRGAPLAKGTAAELEAAALVDYASDLEGLENAGLDQERRPLLLEPQGLKYKFDADVLTLEFILPAGSFATSILREVCLYQDVKERQWQEFVSTQAQSLEAQTNSEAKP
ncbi:Pseudouridylate synthase [Shewanella denitrificans OS217]|jgi:tRNA pseudouridine13 synthase|uniref:tRNA pseudouridine synthase D n=1 Tax=Shewanella denitrificans (strain OS217 / ATCC BAA-1090 / DSM 15013) TaxID=318161 RepID=Q12PZ0_SHEDO|nr:tRNA pseudouridine(13) synthase TruD [Shewanella denitrificans]ABE54486.1 Pseudouridylate synthase [Shewanella denitrificans OS217]